MVIELPKSTTLKHMSFMGPGLNILGQRAAPLVGRLKRISAEDEEAEVEEEKEKEKGKEKKKKKSEQ